MNYVIEDLRRYKDAILLRRKLEGLERQKNSSINIDFIERTLKYPEKPMGFLFPEEIKILYKYYKSYLPKLSRKELLNLLGYSTKLSIDRSIDRKVYARK